MRIIYSCGLNEEKDTECNIQNDDNNLNKSVYSNNNS